MHAFLEFLQTDTVVALLASLFIFLFTIFLVVKRWISFNFSFLLLLFCIAVGLAISNYHAISHYTHSQPTSDAQQSAIFMDFTRLGIEELRNEITAEKDRLQYLTNQIQELTDQLNYQRQKLQTFIEENQIHKKDSSETVKSESPSSDN
jgi:hypothetical protein